MATLAALRAGFLPHCELHAANARLVGRSCRIRVQAFLRQRRPVTNIRTVKVGKGKGRQVALRVRKRWRPRVAKLKRLLVREKVRAGRTRAHFWKVRKLIRRR